MDEPRSLANDPAHPRWTAALREDVHRFARDRLLPAMVPTRIVVVDDLPTLPNGKVDRSALRALGTTAAPTAPVGHTTPAELAAGALWSKILGRPEVDADANFFELGGTSLTAVRMAALWAEHGGAPLDLTAFMAGPTIRNLVRLTGGENGWQPVPEAAVVGVGPERLARLASLPADIHPSGVAAGRPWGTVLITGSPRPLEPFLVRAYLDGTDAIVHVLVPAADEETGTERLRDRLTEYGLWRAEDAERLIAVPGDLAQPFLGMAPDTYRTLAKTVELVVCTGECFDGRATFDDLVPANILGTREVFRFAATDVVKTVNHLSVLGTCSATGDPLPAAEVSGGLLQSRWVADQYARQAAERGIPTRTIRVGQVAAEREDTVDLADGFLLAMVRACMAVRAAPDLDLSFPVTSAARVAESVVGASGDLVVPARPVSWREIVSNIRHVGRAVTVVSYDDWLRALSAEHNALTPYLRYATPDGLSPALGYGRRTPGTDVDDTGRELLRTLPSRSANVRMTTTDFTIREHTVPVPLDHADPDGPTIEIFAREIVAAGREHDDLPWLLFLQGGPGAPSPPPAFAGGWLTTALEDHRVLLFDQRGGGRSTPITAGTMAGRTAAEIAAHVRHFRADSIVADAEVLRARITGGAKWTLLGQSYGGFLALTYLSRASEALSAVLISGGVPGVDATVEEVYRHTYAELLRQNTAYFVEHPDDADQLKRLAVHLDTHDVRLPDGARLTSRRLRLVGRNLGMSNGPDRVHAILRQAWDGDEVSEAFLRAIAAETGFTDAQLYALQEFLYAGRDRPTRWAAHRVLPEFPELSDDADPPLLISEMIYPWMFEEFTELHPFAGAAHLLAEESDWPDLYDLDRLAANEVPVAALVYDDDLYTPVEPQLRTLSRIGAAQVVRTAEFHHNGMMRDGELLTRVLEVVRQASDSATERTGAGGS